MLFALGAIVFPLKCFFTKQPVNGYKLLNFQFFKIFFPDLACFCDAKKVVVFFLIKPCVDNND